MAVTTAFAHDEFGRLTALDHTQGATSLAAYFWSYDAAGQLLEQSSPDGSVVYSYDLTGQLTGADWDAGAPLDDESYDYDLSGNRTAVDGTAYTTGDRNQTTFDGTYHYTYDQRGNRSARFQWDAAVDDADSDGQIDDAERRDLTEYTFDALGHLTRVETATEAVDYIYNFEGLRVARHVDSDLDGTRDHSEYFSYGPMGNDVLLDFVDPDGEATASTAELAHRYVWNPAAVDQLLAQEDIDPATQDTNADGILDTPGDTVYPLSDHLHTNRDWAGYDAQTQTTTIIAHVVLDSFGTPDQSASTGLGADISRYLYTSQEWDPLTGLHYYDARWYDPRTGKFISEDPIGFEAGDANLMRYVGNGPVVSRDPTGQFTTAPGLDLGPLVDLLVEWWNTPPATYPLNKDWAWPRPWETGILSKSVDDMRRAGLDEDSIRLLRSRAKLEGPSGGDFAAYARMVGWDPKDVKEATATAKRGGRIVRDIDTGLPLIVTHLVNMKTGEERAGIHWIIRSNKKPGTVIRLATGETTVLNVGKRGGIHGGGIHIGMRWFKSRKSLIAAFEEEAQMIQWMTFAQPIILIGGGVAYTSVLETFPKGPPTPLSQGTGSGARESTRWTPPRATTDRHGHLRAGRYSLDKPAMRPHTTGSLRGGKSQFLYRINERQLVLDAANYADQAGLWVGPKAKVVFDQPIGVVAQTGELTSTVNVYRTSTGFVRGAPGTP